MLRDQRCGRAIRDFADRAGIGRAPSPRAARRWGSSVPSHPAPVSWRIPPALPARACRRHSDGAARTTMRAARRVPSAGTTRAGAAGRRPTESRPTEPPCRRRSSRAARRSRRGPVPGAGGPRWAAIADRRRREPSLGQGRGAAATSGCRETVRPRAAGSGPRSPTSPAAAGADGVGGAPAGADAIAGDGPVDSSPSTVHAASSPSALGTSADTAGPADAGASDDARAAASVTRCAGRADGVGVRSGACRRNSSDAIARCTGAPSEWSSTATVPAGAPSSTR